ncbi:heparinase II/III domain-containing protein [Achromobacter insolitus]|uniref:heparinase II/III domain-containing protein n=1 Tax=Achromobacter insolitus TaxID=217204 RepID=UPI00366E984D
MDFTFLREPLLSIKKNSDFSLRGEEIVQSGKVRLGPFPQVDYVIEWNQNPLENRTWQWRWGSLSVLTYLIAYHAQTQDSRAISMGFDLIEHWMQQFISTQPGDVGISEFVWHDHGTALRAEHVLLFLAHLANTPSEESEKYLPRANVIQVEMLRKHATTLAKEDFYSSHTNHGLEQARILLLLASVFDKEWQDAPSLQATATARLESELDFAFTSEGVHVENSPAYHIFVFKTFISIIQTFSQAGQAKLANAFLPKARKILDYITHILRPDGKVPILGDTEKLRPTDAFDEILGKSREYQEFRYSLTGGKSGMLPRSRFKVYPMSGYVIYRDSWDNRRALHAVFKAGALSSYHRQEDEGNLVVYAFGEDWLIDSGMYNYNQNDPIRKYVRSRYAHNIVVVDGTLYKKDWQELKNSWTLLDERLTGSNNQTTFTFHGLVGVSTERTTQFEPKRITVKDTIVSTDGEARVARTLWHVDDRKTVEVIDSNRVLVRSRKTSGSMMISSQGATVENIVIRRGISGARVHSITSDNANRYEPSTLIEFVCTPSIKHQLKTEITFSQ